MLLIALAFAGCGGVQGSSQFGEVPIVLADQPGADEAGVYLATARGYDEAEGVTLDVSRSGAADFRLVKTPPEGCIAVMAIVRPTKIVLCADEVTLQLTRGRTVIWGDTSQGARKGAVLAVLLTRKADVYDVSVPDAPTTRK